MWSGLTGRGGGGGTDPGDQRYISRIVGVVEIRRIAEPGMMTHLARVRLNCHAFISETPSSC